MRFLKELRVFFVVMMLAFVSTGANAANENDDFDWSPVVDAIIHVESRGNANARNGQYVGVLQMSPTVVKAVNQILKQKGLKRRFSLADRYSVSKSREMFEIFMSYYNPNNSIEKRHKNVERRNGIFSPRYAEIFP